MANGAPTGGVTSRARHEPQPTPAPVPAESVPSKRDLTSWWKSFSKRGGAGGGKKEDEKDGPEEFGIFGVPLQTSIRYANVAISLFDEEGKSYIYGYVPIVVAKCGVFLKEKATDVEGIFRLSGSEKRIKELRNAFNSPDRYGKGLDWTGYTVHDAANILRRYFNQLPEPIIPLEFYERFRDPIRNHQAEAVGHIDGQAPDIGGFDSKAALKTYQTLMTELPPLNRQLLLYILDLLAVFASKSDLNKMTTQNLAAIFQPGILSHPSHDMAPPEYRLSQDVLMFLIDNQDNFLLGMHGTAADEKTMKDVESGPQTPQPRTPTTPVRPKALLTRSTSNSSAGAESVRQHGGVRRNVSVSSRRSKQSMGAPSPVNHTFSVNTGMGIHRSNTAPSKKSPGVPSPRFARDVPSDPSTPNSGILTQPTTPSASAKAPPAPAPAPPVAAPAATEAVLAEPEAMPPSSEDTTPLAAPPNVSSSTGLIGTSANESGSPVSQYATPMATPMPKSNAADIAAEPNPFNNMPAGPSPGATRSISNLFSKPSPSDVDRKETRRPNKLQKKRGPGSPSQSVHSSTHSLGTLPQFDGTSSPGPTSPNPPPASVSKEQSLHPLPDATPQKQPASGLKTTVSPSTSLRTHSTVTDHSEWDPAEGQSAEETAAHGEPAEKEKKRRWRISSTTKKEKETERTTSNPSSSNLSSHLGSNAVAERSTSSLHSAGNPRQSLTIDGAAIAAESSGPTAHSIENGQTVPEKEPEKKGFGGWIKGKLQERRDREAEKQRAKSPPNVKSDRAASMQRLNPSTEGLAVRGRSMDAAMEGRGRRREEEEVTLTPAPTAEGVGR